MGFDRHVFLGTPQSKHKGGYGCGFTDCYGYIFIKGFRRPLHMYIKRCEDEATPHEDTVGNHGAIQRNLKSNNVIIILRIERLPVSQKVGYYQSYVDF